MFNSEVVRQHLAGYGTVWFVAFLLVLAGTLVSNLIFQVSYLNTADVLLAIAFFCLIALSAAYLLGAIFSDEQAGTKIVLALSALVLFMPLMYAPVLALRLYGFFARQLLEQSAIYAGFQAVVTRTMTAVAERIIGGEYVAIAIKVLQVGGAIIGTVAAIAELSRYANRNKTRA